MNDLLEAWAARVTADHEQVERCREVADPADFYAPVVSRFRLDPRRTDDDVLAVLLRLARPDDVWVDVGAGGGRYALPLALAVREVVAVEPSPAMVATLVADAAAAGISNVRVVQAHWPIGDAEGARGWGASAPSADAGLIAHIGY